MPEPFQTCFRPAAELFRVVARLLRRRRSISLHRRICHHVSLYSRHPAHPLPAPGPLGERDMTMVVITKSPNTHKGIGALEAIRLARQMKYVIHLL